MVKLTKNSYVKIILICLLCLLLCFSLGACTTGWWKAATLAGIPPTAPNVPSAPEAPDAPSAQSSPDAHVNYAEIGNYKLDPAEVNSLSLCWTAGTVTMRTGNEEETDGKICVIERATGNARSTRPMKLDVTDGLLDIDYNAAWGLWGCIGFNAKHLEIVFPEHAANHLDRVFIDATSGTYDLSNLACKEFELTLASGNVDAQSIDAEKLHIVMTSGQARFSGAYTDNLNLSLTSGNLSVESTASELPSQTDIDVTSGNMTVALPEQPGFTATLNRTSGNFSCGFSATQQGDRYVVGDGSRLIDVSLTSGSVELQPQ